MRCVLIFLFSLLLHTCISAQIDKLFYRDIGFGKEYMQLRHDGTYLYYQSFCMYYMHATGEYTVNNDTINILSRDKVSLPYFYKARHQDSVGMFKLELENTDPESHLKIYINDTLKIFDAVGIPSTYGNLSTTFVTMQYPVTSVTLQYHLVSQNEFSTYTIPADSTISLRIFHRGGYRSNRLNTDWEWNSWSIKGDSIYNSRGNYWLYSNPEKRNNDKRKKKRRKR